MTHLVNGKMFFDSLLLEYVKYKANDKVESILSKNQQLYNKVDCYGATLLHYAAKYGNKRLVMNLARRGLDINATDKFGYTPVEMSSANGYTDCVAYLLGEIANIPENIPNDAVAKLLVKHIIESSIDNEAKAKQLVKYHCTLGRVVAFSGDSAIIKLMISNGYSVNERDYLKGETALHLAVQMTDLQNVKMLVEHGADVNAMDNGNKTPLCRLDIKSHDTLEKLQILKIMLENGAAIQECCTFLVVHYVSRKNEEIVRLFLKNNVDFDLIYEGGETLLHLLVQVFDVSVLKLLRGKKFNVNARDNSGCSALLHAVTKQCIKSVEFLLDIGADPNVGGESILLHALRSKSDTSLKIIALLLQSGADIQTEINDTASCGIIKRQTLFNFVIALDCFPIIELVLAQLALLESNGQPIKTTIRDQIHSHDTHRCQFDLYKHQIEVMKRIAVYKSMTLYNLLTATNREILHHAKDNEFNPNFESTLAKIQLNPYYLETILRRTDKARAKIEGMEKIAYIFYQVPGLHVDKFITSWIK